jgi:hypothetical protein
MFPALLADPHEALPKRHLGYCVCLSVGCGTFTVWIAPSADEQVMMETYRGL